VITVHNQSIISYCNTRQQQRMCYTNSSQTASQLIMLMKVSLSLWIKYYCVITQQQ